MDEGKEMKEMRSTVSFDFCAWMLGKKYVYHGHKPRVLMQRIVRGEKEQRLDDM